MSEILKQMAMTVLVRPEATPSSEASSAALLFSHVAWNRANGDEIADATYKSVLSDMEISKPDFWKELKSNDPEDIILELIAHKNRHYPHDSRIVLGCSTIGDKVRVEWID
jgi:hypothetical protein